MTTRQSLIFDAYTAYLGIVTAALPAFTPYDGPQPRIPTDKQAVLIGVPDALTGGTQRSVDAGVQDWESLGATARMETFIINSSLIVWTGDNDLAGCRQIAADALDAIGSALRPPPHGTGDGMLGAVLNQNGTGTGWCGFTVGGFDQLSDERGVFIQAQFTLACTARV